MKILVLGGSQFVGRHVVECLCRFGHSVSVMNRGMTLDELPSEVSRIRGDRQWGTDGLSALSGGRWDVCIDVSGYTPLQVRPAAELLRSRVDHYIYMSAVSVYGDPPDGPVSEDAPLVSPVAEDVTDINAETYGRLKVTCEGIVLQTFGDACTIIRPQIVAGPYDPQDRFSYWVRRATQSGAKLAPGDGTDYLQVIDATDLAQWTCLVCESKLPGIYNLAGPRIRWDHFIRELGGNSQDWVWISREVISSSGVTEFELPLYRQNGGRRSQLMNVSSQRAVDAGLTLSQPQETISRVRSWVMQRPQSPALSADREAWLISYSHQNSTP